MQRAWATQIFFFIRSSSTTLTDKFRIWSQFFDLLQNKFMNRLS